MNRPLAPAADPAAVGEMSLTQCATLIASGALSPVDATEALLERIARHDGAVKSYQTVMAPQARAEAAARADELSRGLSRGPLHGVPIAVKDLCMTADAPTAAGMAIHRTYMANADSTVVARLRRAGAVILGKLAMTEGAFSGHHPEMPTPLNPWNPDIWTGASSSGSGAATAAGLCLGSLGSDTGGSIRFPSHACGVTGLKPTWGRVSRAGVFALADSLDHVGPMARSAADCAAILAAMAGPDPRDPTASTAPVQDYVGACGKPAAGLTVGFDREGVLAACAPEVAAALEAAVAALESVGVRVVPMTLPDATGIGDCWTHICSVETLIAHEGAWPARKAEYGPQLSGLLEIGETVTPLMLGKAMQWRLGYAGAWERAVLGLDMVLLPVVGAPTHDLTAWGRILSGEDAGGVGELIRFTAPADMTGHPSLTLPAGFDSRGAPIGVQLIGRKFDEAALLTAGHAFQSVTDWHVRRPDLARFAA